MVGEIDLGAHQFGRHAEVKIAHIAGGHQVGNAVSAVRRAKG